MTRDRDGILHLLLNRCAHRGNQVCDDAKGNSSTFRCPYHGWTYRNNGELVGFPFFKGYGQRKLDLATGAGAASRLLPGLCVRQFRQRRTRLVEHLGAAAGEIDRLVGCRRKDKSSSPPAGCSTRHARTGNCWRRMKPTGITRSSCTARYSGSPAARSVALQRCLDRGDAGSGQRAQRERSASGVPQVRRTDALVRHHRVPGARLRRGDADKLRCRGREAS